MNGINDRKTPGLDGLNVVFFKKSCYVTKGDVYAAVKEFFHTRNMLRQVNCTSITLVPKVPNPTLVKDFRPIAFILWFKRLSPK